MLNNTTGPEARVQALKHLLLP